MVVNPLVPNIVRLSAIQAGAATENIEQNIESNLKLLEQAAAAKPDFVLFSELCTTPYFCGRHDPRFFQWADTIPGKTTAIFSQKAKQYQLTLILPMFERTEAGDFYNSAVVIGPDGAIVPGVLPDGSGTICYRKNHLPSSYDEVGSTLRSDEKFYFRPGTGFPVFKTAKATIGILICWDKRFTEGWRALALQGAQIIFNPIATWGNWRTQTYEMELRVMALYNEVFVVGCGKCGTEVMEKERVFGGGSYIVDPTGRLIKKQAPEEGQILVAEVDLAQVNKARVLTPVYRDRRPELYGILCQR